MAWTPGYVKWLMCQEWYAVAKSFLPEGVWRLRRFLRYRKEHPGAFVSSDSIVAASTSLGAHCIIRRSHVGLNVSLGAYSTIGNDCMIGGKGGVDIGSYCSVGPSCMIWSENHNAKARSHYPFIQMRDGLCGDREYENRPVSVGNDVWIGARVMITAGAKIGDGCIVAAGSVVTAGEYEPYSLIAGVPAKTVRARFTKAERDQLLEMQWWTKGDDKVFWSLVPFLQEEPALRSATSTVIEGGVDD